MCDALADGSRRWLRVSDCNLSNFWKSAAGRALIQVYDGVVNTHSLLEHRRLCLGPLCTLAVTGLFLVLSGEQSATVRGKLNIYTINECSAKVPGCVSRGCTPGTVESSFFSSYVIVVFRRTTGMDGLDFFSPEEAKAVRQDPDAGT